MKQQRIKFKSKINTMVTRIVIKYVHSNESTFLMRISFGSVPKIQLGTISVRSRSSTETNFADTEVEELIAMLRETENLEEQGDILQYLVDTQGLDYNTGILNVIRSFLIESTHNKIN